MNPATYVDDPDGNELEIIAPGLTAACSARPAAPGAWSV